MSKDFEAWGQVKRIRHEAEGQPPYFHQREVWWVALGANVGVEEDGKGLEFGRPVVVKKFNAGFFYGVPLSTSSRCGAFHHPFSYRVGTVSVALLSQLRPLAARRLIRKDGTVAQADFDALMTALTTLIGGQ